MTHRNSSSIGSGNSTSDTHCFQFKFSLHSCAIAVKALPTINTCSVRIFWWTQNKHTYLYRHTHVQPFLSSAWLLFLYEFLLFRRNNKNINTEQNINIEIDIKSISRLYLIKIENSSHGVFACMHALCAFSVQCGTFSVQQQNNNFLQVFVHNRLII